MILSFVDRIHVKPVAKSLTTNILANSSSRKAVSIEYPEYEYKIITGTQFIERHAAMITGAFGLQIPVIGLCC